MDFNSVHDVTIKPLWMSDFILVQGDRGQPKTSFEQVFKPILIN